MLSIFGRNINKCFVEFKRQNKITRPKIHQMMQIVKVHNILESKLLKQQFEVNKTFDDISSKNAYNFKYETGETQFY